MRVQYKQKCSRCKKNYVLTNSRNSYVLCYECQKGNLSEEITDPEYKKLFDIPEELYRENTFLRNIKSSYIKNKSLSEKQVAAFKKVVEAMKRDKNNLLGE